MSNKVFASVDLCPANAYAWRSRDREKGRGVVGSEREANETISPNLKVAVKQIFLNFGIFTIRGQLNFNLYFEF